MRRAAQGKCSVRHAHCSVFTKTLIATILSDVSGMKAQATMASKTLNATDRAIWPGRTVSFGAFAADLERRRVETGVTELPRHTGKRRTASKKALLAAIKDAGGNW